MIERGDDEVGLVRSAFWIEFLRVRLWILMNMGMR